MVALSDRYLMVRAEDHVVLGVQWWGAELASSALLTLGAGGGLLVTFPPQHLGEGAFPDDLALFISSGQLAGLTQLAIGFDASTPIFLSVTPVLAAMRTGRVLDRHADDGTRATAIEMPYGLCWTPVSTAVDVTCVHPTDPVAGPSTAVGLWRTRVSSGGGVVLGDPEVVARAVEPSALPLDAAERQLIVDANRTRPAAVNGVELSSLGGSMSVRTAWDDLDWSQEIALGRDQHVRFVVHGMLYPFGHRAVYVMDTDRRFVEVDGTAALRIHRTLIVTEPSKSVVVDDDAALNRQFPFDDVEITTQVFADLGPPAHHDYVRPTPDTSEIDGQIAALQRDIDGLVAGLSDAINETWLPGTLGTPEDQAYVELGAALGPREDQLAELRRLLGEAEDLQRIIDQEQKELDRLEREPVDIDGLHSPETEAAIAELSGSIADDNQRLRDLGAPSAQAVQSLDDQLAPDRRRLADLLAAITPLLAPPHSIDALAGHGVEDAVTVQGKQAEIRQLEQDKQDLLALVAPREWIIGPTVAGGAAPLRVPVRCTTRAGDQAPLAMDVPMLFVVEFHLLAEHGMPEFHSLTDSDGPTSLTTVLDACFAQHAEGAPLDPPHDAEHGITPQGAAVDVGGVLVDVVHASQPAAGDRVEVYGISLTGQPHGGTFVPAIAAFQAALPAVRNLLGEAHGAATALTYDQAFLEHGEVTDVALRFVGPPFAVDFRNQADKSGGLVAPVISATGLSRLHGPVSVDGLVKDAEGHLDPAKLLGDGASILGFDLRTLLDNVITAPTIVQQVVGGGPPGVKVEWKDLALQPDDVIEAAPAGATATFGLTVDASAGGTTTDCRLRNVALCFPSRADPLLKLSFATIQFIQQPGREPALKLGGVTVGFFGDLELLQGLQDKVDLGGNVPKVTVATDRVGVGYAFEVPDADCGEFSLRNIAIRAGLDVPFHPTDADVITLSLGFASRATPFNLSVMALGGGGYIDVQLDRTGLRRMELSLEFGATLALDFGIVSAEVHALGGAATEIGPGTHRSITGFVRIGGSVELLNLLTVTIELVVRLRYDGDTNELTGRATLVVEVDLTLYSDSIELDSGEWHLLGGSGPAVGALDEGAEVGDGGLAAWQRYRQAFAMEGT